MARPINTGRTAFHVICSVHKSKARKKDVGDCLACFLYRRSKRRRESDLRYEREGIRTTDRLRKKKSAEYRNKNREALKRHLCSNARVRGRKTGIGGTISVKDLYWPEICPVLGIPLLYETIGGRSSRDPRLPSLDRWDNRIGYYPGNVFVISLRANVLKNNATSEELLAVYRYASQKPNH